MYVSMICRWRTPGSPTKSARYLQVREHGAAMHPNQLWTRTSLIVLRVGIWLSQNRKDAAIYLARPCFYCWMVEQGESSHAASSVPFSAHVLALAWRLRHSIFSRHALHGFVLLVSILGGEIHSASSFRAAPFSLEVECRGLPSCYCLATADKDQVQRREPCRCRSGWQQE